MHGLLIHLQPLTQTGLEWIGRIKALLQPFCAADPAARSRRPPLTRGDGCGSRAQRRAARRSAKARPGHAARIG